MAAAALQEAAHHFNPSHNQNTEKLQVNISSPTWRASWNIRAIS